MNYVFMLEHVYEVGEKEEIKFIGVFSSESKAKEAIRELIPKKGFSEHPETCFVISKSKIDEFGWKEGFINWEDAE